MKKLLLILLCLPMIFSCGESTEETTKEKLETNEIDKLKKEIIYLDSINARQEMYYIELEEQLREVDLKEYELSDSIAKLSDEIDYLHAKYGECECHMYQ